MKRLLSAIVLTLCSSVAVCGTAEATPVLDQSQSQFLTTSGFLGYVQTFAQTFTVGISGRLDGISLVVAGGDKPLDLRLLDTVGGVPSFSAIFRLVM